MQRAAAPRRGRNAAVDALVAHTDAKARRRERLSELSDTLHVCVNTHDNAVLVAAALSRADSCAFAPQFAAAAAKTRTHWLPPPAAA